MIFYTWIHFLFICFFLVERSSITSNIFEWGLQYKSESYDNNMVLAISLHAGSMVNSCVSL